MKNKKNLIFTIAVFIIALCVYIPTAAPDVSFIDCGELAAVCSTLGIAHPSGYPLFTLIGYLWTHLPVPFTEVYWLNILSSVLTAAAAAMFFNLLLLIFNNLRLTKKNSGKKHIAVPESDSSGSSFLVYTTAFIISIAFAFARTVWAQANTIEVYSLQIFLLTTIFYLFLKASFARERSRHLFLAAGFVFGLGMSNHLTTMFSLPALLFLYFKQPGEKFSFGKDKLKFIGFIAIFILLGLSFYLYLPLRSSAEPTFNWGWVHRSLEKFLYHFQGKQYQIWMFSGSEFMKDNFFKFIKLLPLQFGWVGLAPLCYGVYVVFRASKELFWFLWLIIIVYLLYTLNYSIPDIDNYFIPVFLGLWLFAAAGLYAFARMNKKLVYAFVLIPLLSFALNLEENNYSGDCMAAEYTRIMTDNLEPDAVIISSQWDYFVSPFFYKQKVENLRPDITIIDPELVRRTWYQLTLEKWYPDLMAKCKPQREAFMRDLEVFEKFGAEKAPPSIQANYEAFLNCIIDSSIAASRPVYITIEFFDKEKHIGAAYRKYPQGFALRLMKPTDTIAPSLDKIDISKLIKSAKDIGGRLPEAISTIVSVNIANIGKAALSEKNFDLAAKAFKTALEANPANREAQAGLKTAEQQMSAGK